MILHGKTVRFIANVLQQMQRVAVGLERNRVFPLGQVDFILGRRITRHEILDLGNRGDRLGGKIERTQHLKRHVEMSFAAIN